MRRRGAVWFDRSEDGYVTVRLGGLLFTGRGISWSLYLGRMQAASYRRVGGGCVLTIEWWS